MSNTIVTLKSTDNQSFTIEKENAIKSTVLKNILDEDCSSSVIPLPNLNAKTLALIVELLNKDTQDLKLFVEDQQELSTLFDIINAANYLDAKEMMDFGCQKVADMIKGWTPEEIRQLFGIGDDVAPDEQAVVGENAWAFD